MYRLFKSIAFRIDPEKAHVRGLRALELAKNTGLLRLICAEVPASPVNVMGLRFPNPVGLAAGLDKNAEHIDALATLGFGFIEIGTVTPRPQPGNPKPRLFRLPEHEAIINRMGFNNDGMDAVIERVRRRRFKGIVGVNIGKNFDTPIENATDDYLKGLRAAYPVADYVAVNISSPNTANLRDLQSADPLSALLKALKEAQLELSEQHGREVPLTVKIAPDLSPAEVGQIAGLLLEHRIDGVIATNTTLERVAVAGHVHAEEKGGLSGVPVRDASTEIIRQLATHLKGAIPIIGVGGIMNGKDAVEKMQAGASLVQIYSGLIYRGPNIVQEAVKAIAGL